MSYQSPFKRSVWAHLWWYRTGRAGKPHTLPCSICSHPCPGPRCMTTLHDPYQVLCGYCSRSANPPSSVARMTIDRVELSNARIPDGLPVVLNPLPGGRSASSRLRR